MSSVNDGFQGLMLNRCKKQTKRMNQLVNHFPLRRRWIKWAERGTLIGSVPNCGLFHPPFILPLYHLRVHMGTRVRHFLRSS